jgi:hypothetical protein
VIRFAAGVVAALVLLAAATFVAVRFGYVPARADMSPWPLETWAANTALEASIDREQPQRPYPYGPPTGATLVAGAKLYMARGMRKLPPAAAAIWNGAPA